MSKLCILLQNGDSLLRFPIPLLRRIGLITFITVALPLLAQDGQSTAQAQQTIVIRVAPASISEGDSGTKTLYFPIKLSPAPSQNFTLSVATYERTAGRAKEGEDYIARSFGHQFIALSTSDRIGVQIIGDTILEPDEYFNLRISNASPAVPNIMLRCATSSRCIESSGHDQIDVLGTILNDDVARPPTPRPPTPTPTDSDKEALVALYTATNGTGWTDSANWLNDGVPLNSWHGVETDAEGRVVNLSLPGNNLVGSLPAELDNLTELRHLELAGNQLSGAIPAEFSNLEGLTGLYLGFNQLTGAVPAELGDLNDLESLHLENNQLTGTIPPELGNLTSLRTIHLQGNRLAGELPAELGDLINLESLHLENNQLTGTIPPELGNLTSLRTMHLQGNRLAGELPAELGDLINLESLRLENNQLTGTIPPELGNLTNISIIYLQSNRLTGELPSTFTQLTSLEVFAFDNGDQGVCAPTDGAFQTWLQGISNQDLAAGVTPLGPNCADSTAAPTPPPDPTVTITFGDLNWPSAMLQNRIAQYIAEKGYGYSTEVEFGATLPLFQALRAGDIDVLMEVWLPDQQASWEEALQEGMVSSPGSSLGTDWQSAFVIPKYLQEQYPDLDSVEDLKEEQYKTLFATDDTDGKARLVSCVIGWLCEVVNAKQIEGYGLSEHVHIVNPGDGQALNADITEAYENEEAWLGYQQGTNEPALLFDLVRLEEPAYSDECWTTTMACAYEDVSILVAINTGLSDSAANFVDVLARWDFSVEEAYRPVVRWLADNPDANTESAALWWLRGNSESWSEWVTKDAATSIQNALDNGEVPEGWPEEPIITPDPTPAPSDPCVEAITGSTTINGSWSGDCLSTRTAPRGTGDRYARLYTFTLTKTTEVKISLESSVDTYLYLLAGHGRDGAAERQNDDHDASAFSLATTFDSGITATLEAGAYTIEATTYDAGATGDFTLNVEIVGEPAADCTEYSESPDLAEKVASGELPSVCDRLPSEPVTIPTLGDTGEYGGILRRFYLGPADGCNFFRLSRASLVRFSQDGFSLLPSVARDWEMSEDGKEWTFYLREGMKWSDGDDFTADDFIWQYENVMLNEDLTTTAPVFLNIGAETGSMEKVDDTTVKFVFPQPNFLFPEIVAQADEACYGDNSWRNVPWAPSHYMQQFHIYFNADANALAEDAGFSDWTGLFDNKGQVNLNPDKPTIAPWRFTNTLDAQVALSERNPYFWAVDEAGNQLPYLDGIQLTLVESAEAGTLMAAQGDIDMQGRHIQLDQYTTLKQGEEEGGYSVLTWPAFGGSDVAFFFNMSLPGATGDAIRTREFRQALSLAIDREAIKQAQFLGFGESRQNVPPPGHPHYPGDDIAKLRTEYDPDAANALLDSVFLDKDGEGWRLSNGERIVMSVTVTDAFRIWPDAAQAVGRAWEAVGVKTDVNVTTRAQHFTRWHTNEWAVKVWSEDSTGFTFGHIHKRAPVSIGTFHGPGCAAWLIDPEDSVAFPCADESVALLEMHRSGPGLPEVERDALGREIYRTIVENQYNIGIVGLSPMAHGIIVKKNELRNVPDTAANDWAFRPPNSAFPEQWHFGSESEPVVALPAALSAGSSHACSLNQNGEISCMGVDDSGQVSGYPAGAFTVISVGARHSCAIDEERAVHCWGSDEHGQVSGLPESGEFIAVGAGATHTCAIDLGGRVHCWGSDEHGQSSPPSEGEFVAIGAGDSYTCGLRSDGTMECWGRFAGDDGNSP